VAGHAEARVTLPLADVRVLAVEQFGAGPWGTLQLADLGADVIKIEDPAVRGDVGRYVPPFQEGESSLFFETFNRNKRSVSLDLRHPEGRAVFEDLVRVADVVYSNLRGDQPAKLRLVYDDLKDVNPRIVCCSLSGFGTTGPRAGEGGYDYMMQGLAGWMDLTGEPDGPPTKSGLSLVDLSGGYVSTIAVLAGLWRARRDGVGCDCDISLFETALHELVYVGTWAATKGYTPPRRRNSAHPSIVPFQNFATADGWIVVACPKPKFWERFCGAIERPELAADERFADFAARDRNRDELTPLLERALVERTSAEWLAIFAAAGVPSAPVNDVATALEDPQARARGDVVEFEHPDLGRVRQVASPLRLSGAERPPGRGPFRGEHTEQVLVELCGYEPERVRELATAGVFG
jgi:crotonobetainyl-CoA:carnitine CoA-transferase CaiB-like acyl-CoA transferase